MMQSQSLNDNDELRAAMRRGYYSVSRGDFSVILLTPLSVRY